MAKRSVKQVINLELPNWKKDEKKNEKMKCHKLRDFKPISSQSESEGSSDEPSL